MHLTLLSSQLPTGVKTVWNCRVVKKTTVMGITIISPSCTAFIWWKHGGSSFHRSSWYRNHSRKRGRGMAGKEKGHLSRKAAAVAIRTETSDRKFTTLCFWNTHTKLCNGYTELLEYSCINTMEACLPGKRPTQIPTAHPNVDQICAGSSLVITLYLLLPDSTLSRQNSRIFVPF